MSATARPKRSPLADSTDRLRILTVGDDSRVLDHLTQQITLGGVMVQRERDAATALRALSTGQWNILFVLLDAQPEEQLSWWLEVLGRLAKRPRLVALVRAPSISFALRAGRLGVFDVLPVPVARERVEELLHRALASETETVLPLPEIQAVPVGSHQIVSASSAMLPVFRTMAQVAPSTATVLVLGESGTGKELVARGIHAHGSRAERPFVAVNCSAIPENLLESELFGHEKGAFTGAVARKKGRFERASGGTLFLDEIGDMSLSLQSKILRAIQEREIERVGGTEPIRVDVRLVAATNQDLRAMIEQGRFREDLYYRLAVVTIRMPRLAERENDVLVLTTHFLHEFGSHYGKRFDGISDRALDLLQQHEWLGNVRELRNVIERAVLVTEGGVLRAEHLPEEWRTSGLPPAVETHGRLATLREAEARHIARVLAHTDGQVGEAAQILAVHRNTLARKIKEYGL